MGESRATRGFEDDGCGSHAVHLLPKIEELVHVVHLRGLRKDARRYLWLHFAICLTHSEFFFGLVASHWTAAQKSLVGPFKNNQEPPLEDHLKTRLFTVMC